MRWLLVAVVCVATPILGEDDACNILESLGENICVPKSDESVKHDDNDPTSGEGYDDDDDATLTEHPIWWNYSVDQLFGDHFYCGSVIYGYAEFEGNSDDEIDDEDHYQMQSSGETTEVDDVTSEAQLHRLRQQWSTMREKYIKEVNIVPIIHEEITTDERNKGQSNDEPSIRRSLNSLSSMVVPVRIGDAGPDKGRGVFATELIQKGALISTVDNGNTGVFKVGQSWREFAVSLPRETACNFIEWSWVQTVQPLDETDDDIRNGLTIFIAFDESNLMNSAEWDEVEPNVRCGSPPMHVGDEWGPCRFHYYAARDIAAGEELLINYGDFEDTSQEGWAELGL